MKSIIRKAKLFLKVVIGKEFLIKSDGIYAVTRCGSDYGGWNIVTTNIDNHSIVYSFGVGEDATFDTALIEKFGLTVHAFDPTPKSIEWVKSQGFSNHFVMHEYGIAAFDGTVSFNPPENPNHISHTLLDRPATKEQAISVQVKQISTIMEELGHERIDILKMDIEGAEYDVIDDISQSDIRPQQILVEFHHRFPGIGMKKTKEAIERLKLMEYRLFSVSDTNEEFGFIHESS